ncbi:MAG: hypothetical protein ACF8XB_01280, partial [Planctomycetota bacterium JB042]
MNPSRLSTIAAAIALSASTALAQEMKCPVAALHTAVAAPNDSAEGGEGARSPSDPMSNRDW